MPNSFIGRAKGSGCVMPDREARQEVLREHRQIFETLAKGRKHDLYDAQPEEQVVA